MITNGIWYCGFALGTTYGIGWLSYVCGAYLAWLYTPWACEKIIIIPIALWLCKKLFRKSAETQKQLETMLEEAKSDFRKLFKRSKKNDNN